MNTQTEIETNLSDILIVDDNINNLKLLRTLLTEQGYITRIATNGKMALASVAAKHPDLILLDITMPDMDGFEVCKQLNNNPLTEAIPIIFLSALKEEFDIVRGFADGGVDFITKPFNAEILKARVTTHLAISQLRKDLNNTNDNLEKLIDERTADIKKTNSSLEETQRELSKSEESLKYALIASNEGTFDWDIKHGTFIRNTTYFTMLGYEVNELPETINSFTTILHPDDKEDVLEGIHKLLDKNINELKSTFRLKKKNGDYCWILSKSMVVDREPNGTPLRIVGTQTDITVEKQYEEHLKKLASYDTLTNLPNRHYFTDILNSAISRSKRKSQLHAILFIDLDRFKNINDSLGHSTGDALLQSVAIRLNDILRDNDVVARLGGDEYIILLEDIESSHKAAEISQRIIEVMDDPFDLQGHQVVITPSIGIVLYPEHGKTPEELLKNADAAMYHAKDLGGNTYWYFTDEMNEEAHIRLELEEDIRIALNNNEFILHYQPKVDLHTGEIVGMEGLARWERNDGSIIAPNKFIPIAEETGLIIQIGNQIIHKAAEQTNTWIRKNLFECKIAINISARQFQQKDLLKQLKST